MARLSQEVIEHLTKCIPLNTLKTEALGELIKTSAPRHLFSGDIIFNQGSTDQIHIYLLKGKLELFEFDESVEVINAEDSKAKFPIGHQFPRQYTCKIKGNAEFIIFDSRIINDLLASDKGQDYQIDTGVVEAESGDWMSQLLQCGVFQKLPAANIQAVMMNMEEVAYNAGDSVVVQGDDGDYFYLIHQGRCVVLQDQGNGIDKEIVQLGPGQSFGEDALLSDKPRNSTVRMLTGGVLLRLSKENFVERVKKTIALSATFEELLKRKEEDETHHIIWLDIRPQIKFDKISIKGSINIPLSTLRFQASSLSTDHHYFVVGENEKNGATAAYILVDGGLDTTILKDDFLSISGKYLTSSMAEEEIPPPEVEPELLQADDNELKTKLRQAILTIRKMEATQLKAQERRKVEYKQIKANFGKAKTRLVASELDKQKALAIIQKFTAELDPLKQKLKQKEAELEELNEKVVSLSEFKQQFSKKQHENAGLSDSLTTLKEDYETEIKKLKEQIDDHQIEIKQSAEALKLSDEKVTQQIEALEKLRKKVAEYKARLETQNADLAKKEAEVNDVKDHLDFFKEEKKELVEALEEATNKYQSLVSQNKQTQETQSEETRSQVELKQQLENENKKLTNTLENLTTKTENQKQQQQQEIEQLSEQINTTKTQAESTQQALQVKLDEVEHKRTQEIDDLKSQLSKATENIEISQSDLTNKEQEINALKQYIDEVEIERGTLRESLDKEHNLQSEQQLKNQEEAQGLDEEMRQLIETQQKLKDERHSLQEQIDKLKKERELTATTHRDEVNQFEKEIVKIKHETEENKIQLQSQFDEQLLEKTNQLSQFESELVTVKEDLTQNQQKITNKIQEITDIKERYNALEKELTETLELLEKERNNQNETTSTQQEQLVQITLEKKEIFEKQETLQKELSSYQEKLSTLQTEKTQLSDEQRTTAANLEKERVQRQQQAETTNAELEAKLDDSENEKLKLQQETTKIQEQLSRFEDKLSNALKESETLRQSKDKVKEKLQQTETKIYQQEGALEEQVATLKKSQQQIQQVTEEKQRAFKHAETLTTQVNDLRSVLEEYVDQIKSTQPQYTEEEINEIESLKTELNMVREQASSDVTYMRNELQKAQQRLKELES